LYAFERSITKTDFPSTDTFSEARKAPAIPKNSKKIRPKKMIIASKDAKKLLKKLFTANGFRRRN
jgi:hypothetical protein